MTEHKRILKFLKELRASHEHMAGVFTNGSCYNLYLVMRVIWSSAIPYRKPVNGGSHIIIYIYDRFYDINGQVKLCQKQLSELEPQNVFQKHTDPMKWRKKEREKVIGFRPPIKASYSLGLSAKITIFFYKIRVRVKRRLYPKFVIKNVQKAVMQHILYRDLQVIEWNENLYSIEDNYRS